MKISCLYTATSCKTHTAVCQLTLSNAISSASIRKDLPQSFNNKHGFTQDVFLACDFLTLFLDKIIRKAELNREGMVFSKSAKVPAYADDIDIIELNNGAMIYASFRLNKKAKPICLVVNENCCQLALKM